MKKMLRIREKSWAARSATPWLLGLALATTFTGAVSAAEAPEQVTAEALAEREALLRELDQILAEARAFAADADFREADAAYRKALKQLDATSGTLARDRYEKANSEYMDMKAEWARRLLDDAYDCYSAGEYSEARSLAADAALVDARRTADVNSFIERCKSAEAAQEYRDAVASPEAMAPGYDKRQDEIAALMRRAVGYYEANALDDACATCEKVFKLDPYYAPAAELLERIYERLYTYGSARRSTDYRAMIAYMNWNWVAPVFPDKSQEMLAVKPMVKTSSSGVMAKLDEIIIPRYEVRDQSIADALMVLSRFVKSYDPSGAGVEFLTLISGDEVSKLPKISLELNNIPASQVLKYICMLTKTKYYVDETGRVNINFAGEMEKEEFPIRSSVVTRISRGTIRTDSSAGMTGMAGGAAGLPGMGQNRNGAGLPGAGQNLPGAGLPGGQNLPGAGQTGTGRGTSGAGSINLPGNLGNSGALPFGADASGALPFRNSDDEAFAAGLSGRTPGVGKKDSGSKKSNRSSNRSSKNSGSGSGSSTGGLGGVGGSSTGAMGSLTTVSSGGGTSLDPRSVNFVQANPEVPFEQLEEYFTQHGIPFNGVDSTITYDSASGTITAINTSANLSKMAKLLNLLNAQDPLVLIEAKVIELSENDIDQLGFNWFLNVTHNPDPPAPNHHHDVTNLDIASPDNPLRNADQYALVQGLKIFPNFGESLFSGDFDVDLSLTINAVSQNKNAEVLTAPRVLTENNVPASIVVSETRYYPTDWDYGDDDDDDDSSSSSNNNWGDSSITTLTAPTPEFDDGGTELGINFAVLPEVDNDLRTITLSLQIKTRTLAEKWHYPGGYDQRIYTITAGATGAPEATLVQRMVTDIWMPVYGERSIDAKIKVYDGETIVLGGMIDSNTVAYDDKWPILGDLPLIGRLFRMKNDTAQKSNMLVFVTTRLINDDGVPLRNERALRGVPTFRN